MSATLSSLNCAREYGLGQLYGNRLMSCSAEHIFISKIIASYECKVGSYSASSSLAAAPLLISTGLISMILSPL